MLRIFDVRSIAIDLFCLHRKFLIFNLVKRNLKLKYRQSVLGFLWTLLVPAASALVYFAVFQFVMKVQIPHYLLFVMTGILPWTFFATALTNGLESVVGNQGLVNKVPLPLHAFPFAESLTGYINLLLGIPVLLVIFAFSQVEWTFALLLIPVYLTLLFIQAYSLSLILSIAFIFFRDLRHVLGIVIQMWFYATPILYVSSMIPARAVFILWANPVAFIFEGLHLAVMSGTTLPIEHFAASCVWSFGLFFLAASIARMNRARLVESL